MIVCEYLLKIINFVFGFYYFINSFFILMICVSKFVKFGLGKVVFWIFFFRVFFDFSFWGVGRFYYFIDVEDLENFKFKERKVFLFICIIYFKSFYFLVLWLGFMFKDVFIVVGRM